MPITYTGNPLGPPPTLPTPPAPNAIPVITIPQDGDPLVALSVDAAFICITDYLAYIQTVDIRQKLPILNFTPIRENRSQEGVTRSLIDNDGFPNGDYAQITENWQTNSNVTVGTNQMIPNTNMSIVTNGSSEAYLPPDIVSPGYPCLQAGAQLVTVGSNAGDYATVCTTGDLVIGPPGAGGRYVVAEFDLAVRNYAGAFNDVTLSAGFMEASSFGAAINTNFNHALIVALSASTTWVVSTANTGGRSAGISASNVESPIPAFNPLPTKMRIEAHSSSSPYGAGAFYFINGVQVACSNVNPIFDGARLRFVIQARANIPVSTGPVTLWCGPVRITYDRM